MKTSKKQCNEAAAMLEDMSGIWCEFYGREERDASRKVFIHYGREWLEFKTNGDAYEWMLKETIKHF